MPITRDRINKVYADNSGTRTLNIVLTDGVDKKAITWSGPDGGIPDDDAGAKALIDANVDFLWNHKGAKPFDDSSGNIATPKQEFDNVKPDKANINAANSVPELRDQVAFLLDAVEELRKLVD